MATRKPATKRAKSVFQNVIERIKERSMAAFLYHGMLNYGKHVVEERAVPDFRDGLKPVQRKSMWAMYKLGLISGKPVKTARVVGEVLGKYHPHGDKSVQDAITILAQQRSSPVFGGDSNWGSITGDAPAAMRYTNVKLSEYGALFFDPYYAPVMDLVPNYDGSEEEPVVLNALIPNILVNGGSGVAVAVRTDLPSFTINSVIKCAVEAANKGGATPAMCASILEFSTTSNAVVHKTKQKTNVINFFKTGTGPIIMSSRIVYSAKDKAFIVNGVAPFRGINDRLKMLLEVPTRVPEIAGVDDQSEQWKLDFRFPLKRGVAEAAVEAVKKKLETLLSFKMTFRINITERFLINDTGLPKAKAKFRSSTVPDIINDWLRWRVELEVRATKYHMDKLDIAIRRNEVLRLACEFRDFIFGLAKSNKTDEQVKKAIKDKLKVSDEEAAFVFDMKWRSLRTLEDKQIAERMAEQAKLRKQYQQRIAKPGDYVVQHLTSLIDRF